MKKKLEADLISIAHRVLQIKNKSDVNQLYIETQKLYEKLSILRFVEEYFGEAKPTIGQAEIVEKMKQFFEENHLSDFTPKQPQTEMITEEIEEEIKEEIEELVEKTLEEETIAETSDEEFNTNEFRPAFELDKDHDEEEDTDVEEEEITKATEEVQISFFDLLGTDFKETTFVKVDQNDALPSENTADTPKIENLQEEEPENDLEESTAKSISLNEKLSKGIHIDLNDKIAFVKHLFSNSDEDYNRVLNQLITYDNFDEAHNFIEDMVKPDYNNWEGKEDYEQRFIAIIEKKFA